MLKFVLGGYVKVIRVPDYLKEQCLAIILWQCE